MFIHVNSPKSCLVDFNVYPKNINSFHDYDMIIQIVSIFLMYLGKT